MVIKPFTHQYLEQVSQQQYHTTFNHITSGNIGMLLAHGQSVLSL